MLIRALELDRKPIWLNTKDKLARVAAGPGKLCRALKIDLGLNGVMLQPQAHLWLEPRDIKLKLDIVQTTRIGITKGIDIPWRWYIKDHPSVSKK